MVSSLLCLYYTLYKSVQIAEKSGEKVAYEGVTLAEALKKAGKIGAGLSG